MCNLAFETMGSPQDRRMSSVLRLVPGLEASFVGGKKKSFLLEVILSQCDKMIERVLEYL